MLTYEEALAQILSQTTRLTPVQTPLANAHGLVLAEDLTTAHDLPPFDNSSMDGFAVRASDHQRLSQAVLPVQGDIAAGELSVPALQPGNGHCGS